MGSFLGEPQRSFKTGLVALNYRNFYSDGAPFKLKIEINSREHFAHLRFVHHTFKSESSFARGEVSICTYTIEELLATKMRALYQRRKGRDLFDLHTAIARFSDLNCDAVVECFQKYMDFSEAKISQKLYGKNLEDKIKYAPFLEDIEPLLPHQKNEIDPHVAYQNVLEKLIARMN